MNKTIISDPSSAWWRNFEVLHLDLIYLFARKMKGG